MAGPSNSNSLSGGKHLLESRWSAGEPAIGAWSMTGSPFAAELLASAAPDYVVVDCQHGLTGLDGMVHALAGLRHLDAVSIVRTPANDPSWIGKALDAGAEGVIIPMVGSRADAELGVDACRYPPHGRRSYGPVRGSRRLGATLSEVDAGVLCLPMIESREGVEVADAICSVGGVDGIYVGPSDLAIALGVEPVMMHRDPDHEEALRFILDACVRNDVVPGIHALHREEAARYLDLGYRLVTVCSDVGLVRGGARNAIDVARRHLAERTDA
jgi:4-hydroxy-2-oxoheptanedioate aldolase